MSTVQPTCCANTSDTNLGKRAALQTNSATARTKTRADTLENMTHINNNYSLRGSNPRPMAHKTIALTTELREHVPSVPRQMRHADLLARSRRDRGKGQVESDKKRSQQKCSKDSRVRRMFSKSPGGFDAKKPKPATRAGKRIWNLSVGEGCAF